MKNPYILALDVDGTLVDSISPWFTWCNEQLAPERQVKPEDILGQNGDLIPHLWDMGIRNPFQYWEQSNLYDDMAPHPACKLTLIALRERLQNILERDVVFIAVSRCAPEHIHSKRKFLQKHFGNMIEAFIDTADKSFVEFDAIIDDSLDTVNQLVGTNKKVIVPSTHLLVDHDKFDKTMVKFIGEQGKYDDMWRHLRDEPNMVTQLAYWLSSTDI